MEFSSTGWIARYSSVPVYRLIEAWNEQGLALVVDERAGALVAASAIAGFTGLERAPQVAALATAAPGWQLRVWDSEAEDDTFIEPIAAWLADTEGNVYAIGGTNDSHLATINPGQRSEILPPGDPRTDLT